MNIIEELVKKNIPLTFSSYFKYSFSFYGKFGEYEISASLGGSSEDIYKLEITPITTMVLNKDNFNYISVKNTQTGEVTNWSE